MTAPVPTARPTGFRKKLMVAMMLTLSVLTGLGLLLAQRRMAATMEADMEREFQAELERLHSVQEMRHVALAERCRGLVRRPRIHAALEDDAADLLYPSAKDELRDLVEGGDAEERHSGFTGLRGRFYRFLDASGAVMPIGNSNEAGVLSAGEETKLGLQGVPAGQELGYLARVDNERAGVDEIITMPIISSESGDAIAALVVGFEPVSDQAGHQSTGIRSGIWLGGKLYQPDFSPAARTVVEAEVAKALAGSPDGKTRWPVELDGVPHLLFYTLLNPRSLYPPAFEVSLYPLSESLHRQQQVRWQILAAGASLLLAGYIASHFLAGRLSVPVEKLAVDSVAHRVQRERAEAALEVTSKELQRAARFSADASHQLKTPLTVLRAGLEELLARENFTPELREEIAALVHQTYRLGHVVEDLLLLSRMDAGRLQLSLTAVNLSDLIEGWVDDLSASPDGLDLQVETSVPADLFISGEKRYTGMIVQNLLENARKYNVPGGKIQVAAKEEHGEVFLSVTNTGRPISPAAQGHIFERFHRGAVGENVPGYGLGLNLARELARLHGGDLWLSKSDEKETQFCVRFPLAPHPARAYASA